MPKQRKQSQDEDYEVGKQKRRTKSQPSNKHQTYQQKETSKQKRKDYNNTQRRKQTKKDYNDSLKAKERTKTYQNTSQRKQLKKQQQQKRPSRGQQKKNYRKSLKAASSLCAYYDEDFQNPQPHSVGQMVHECHVCQALFFKGELKQRMNWCCKQGVMNVNSIRPFPPHIIDIMTNPDNDLFHVFKEYSRTLNFALSFASIGAYKPQNSKRNYRSSKLGNAPGQGPYVFRCQGIMCHKMATFQPKDQRPPKGQEEEERPEYNPRYSQIYMLDPKEAYEVRKKNNTKDWDEKKERLMTIFQRFITQQCVYVQFFEQVKDIIEFNENKEEKSGVAIKFKKERNMQGKIYCQPETEDIAAVYQPITLDESQQRYQKDLIVYFKEPKGGVRFQEIRLDNQNNLPLTYPITFPYGYGGWHTQMLKHEKVPKPKKNSKKQSKKIMEEQKEKKELLDAQQILQQQNPFFSEQVDLRQYEENLQEDNEQQEQGEGVGQKAEEKKNKKHVSMRDFFRSHLAVRKRFNPVINSGRLLQQLIVDMQVQRQMNDINYLILQRGNKMKVTAQMITNARNNQVGTKDDQKKTILLPKSFVGSPRFYQDLYRDSMGLVSRMGKPDLFITITCNPNWEDITSNLGGTTWNNRPDIVARVFNIKLNQIIEDINKHEIFGKVKYYFYTIEFQKRGLPHCHLLVCLDEESKPGCHKNIIDKITRATVSDINDDDLKQQVLKHMIHRSCKTYRKGQQGEQPVCFVDGKCKRNFPKALSQETTSLESGFPLYKRNTQEDRYVIPYNPYLLMKYDCHINVECCSGLKVVKYLYKYVTKGMTMVGIGQRNEKNEVQTYQAAKYLCPAEASWRIIGNNLHNKSHAVTVLPIHLKDEVYKFVDEDLTIEDIGKVKLSTTKLLQFFELNKNDPEARRYLYEEIPIHYVWKTQDMQWKPRKRFLPTISRVSFVSIKRQQAYCLRLLLKQCRGPQSYEDVRTINGITYGTFLQAAIQKGLFITNDEWKKCMIEICRNELNIDIIRHTFCYILTFTQIINGMELWNEFKVEMTRDFTYHNPLMTQEEAQSRALLRIEEILQGIGKSLKDCCLPQISDYNLKIQQEEMLKEEEDMKIIKLIQDYEQNVNSLNDDQRDILQAVERSLNYQQENKLFFINGAAGTGKTYLYRVIAGMVAKRGQKCLQSATTGIAATLLNGASTVHKCFSIPFGYKLGAPIIVDQSTEHSKKLIQCPIFIIDECSSLSKDILQYINELLQILMNNRKPFGNKIIILGGDFQQTLPVIEKGGQYETINNCIKKSNLWQFFKTYKLTKNERCQPEEFNHKEWTKEIGEGAQNVVEVPQEYISHDVVEEIYGDMKNFQPDHVILAPTNKIVNEINQKVLDKLTQQLHTFKNETIANMRGGDEKVQQSLYPQDFLNSIDLPSIPPYELKLKIGAIVMLMTNVDVSKGLCNGTRMRIIDILPHSIKCQVISGYNKGQTTWIPRFKMTRSSEELPFSITRITFPVKLCFAMTINKSQGQTFEKVGLYLIDPVFAHGQLYVACTRVKKGCCLRIQLHPKQESMKSKRYFMENVVYKEVLGDIEGDPVEVQKKITDYFLVKNLITNKTKIVQATSSANKKRRIFHPIPANITTPDPTPPRFQDEPQMVLIPTQDRVPIGLNNMMPQDDLGKANFCYLNCVIQTALVMELDLMIKQEPRAWNEGTFIQTCRKLRQNIHLREFEYVYLWRYMFSLLFQIDPHRASSVYTKSPLSVEASNILTYDEWLDLSDAGEYDQLFIDLTQRLQLQHIHTLSVQSITFTADKEIPCKQQDGNLLNLTVSNPGKTQTINEAIQNSYSTKQIDYFYCCDQQHFKKEIITIPADCKYLRIRIMPQISKTNNLSSTLKLPINTTTTQLLQRFYEGQERNLQLKCLIFKNGGIGGGHYTGIFKRNEQFYFINDKDVHLETYNQNEVEYEYVEDVIYEIL